MVKRFCFLMALIFFHLLGIASEGDSIILKKNLKILDIGNSYTDDAVRMLPLVISESGADVSDMCLYEAFYSGGSLKKWYDTYNNANTLSYTISKVFGGLNASIKTGTGGGRSGSLFRQALTDEQWDLIVIHQESVSAAYYEQWGGTGDGGYLNEMLDIIKTHQPNAKIGFYIVHSYMDNYYLNSEKSSLTRWQLIANSVKQLCQDYEIDFILPYGTAVENLRSSSWNNAYDLTRDGTHCGYGLCSYAAACCYYQALIAPRCGISVLGNPARYVHTGSTNYPAVDVTDENAIVAQKAAFLAIEDMYTCKNPDDYYVLDCVVDGEDHKKLVKRGDIIKAADLPLKKGYTFVAERDLPDTMPDTDVTVEGSFVLNTYRVVYLVNGDTCRVDSIPYGAEIVPAALLEKEGYTFSGWSEIPDTMPDADVTVTGSLTVNSYHLTYLVDGEVFKVDEVPYGTAILRENFPQKEGYTYTLQNDLPDTMPATDLTATGTFSLNTYRVSYLIDGDTCRVDSIPYGSTIVPADNPEKEGYTFSGWSELPDVMPASDLTATGSFAINVYRLNYVVDGETVKADSISFGSALSSENFPEREGYTFVLQSELPESMPASDLTLSGSFSLNVYRVSYLIDGDTCRIDSIPYGSTIVPADNPEKEGYTFSGWSELPDVMPASDLTATGSFALNVYRLTYMVDGETVKADSISFGSALSSENFPEREGYTFVLQNELPELMPASDLTLSGSFTLNVYRVSYLIDGDTCRVDSIPYGSTIVPADNLVKEGYTFSGWSELPDVMPASDLTVTGSFTLNVYRVSYLIDGDTCRVDSIPYDAEIVPADIPVKEGYTFSGWSELPVVMPASDLTATGSFSLNTYRVVYLIDNDTCRVDSIPYGSEIVPAVAPEKEGYTFSWSELPAVMPASDLTVTGTFTLNTYRVIYLIDGDTCRIDFIPYGATIEPMELPEREGGTFSGWSEIPQTMPAKDVEVRGSFVAKLYTLTYMVDGEVYNTVSVAYGAPLDAVEYPVEDGYVFSGWGTLPETMPACNMIVNGVKMKQAIEGDMNHDGVVDISDVTKLVNVILNK